MILVDSEEKWKVEEVLVHWKRMIWWENIINEPVTISLSEKTKDLDFKKTEDIQTE